MRSPLEGGGDCVHELFEMQVELTPDALAVLFEERHLNYRELNRRSNQLAHYLRKLGVGPEVLVGFCVERSLEMVVGILGILKAGGAYVPLDPAYPMERLAFMLEDAQVTVLLTQQRLLERLAAHPLPQGRVVCLDADWESITQESEQNLQSGAVSENLAYVIYTSGSTGRPKGAMIRHRARPGTGFESDQDNAIAFALTRPAANAGASGGADSSLHHRRGELVARAHRLLAKARAGNSIDQ